MSAIIIQLFVDLLQKSRLNLKNLLLKKSRLYIKNKLLKKQSSSQTSDLNISGKQICLY